MRTIKESILKSTGAGEEYIKTKQIKEFLEKEQSTGKIDYESYTINPDYTVSFKNYIKIKSTNLPFKIKEVTGTGIIMLDDFEDMKNLPDKTTFLTLLNCDTKNIEKLPKVINGIKFENCSGKALPKFQNNVQSVNIKNCDFTDLSNLCLSDYIRLQKMKYLKNLKYITLSQTTDIEISGCPYIKSLEDINTIGSYGRQSIVLTDCVSLSNLKMPLKSCRMIKVRGNNNINTFEGCPDNEYMYIDNVGKLKEYYKYPKTKTIIMNFTPEGKKNLPCSIEEYRMIVKEITGAHTVQLSQPFIFR